MSSNDIAVSVRGLSKSYTIAHNAEKHTSLSEALTHRFKNLVQKVEKETFWALKDVEFDIKKGDVVGIIGRNGAGKSTLLKVLSQITEPTAGEIRLYGRVGSLLEVGTGFHPELTGRENVFLNGAILGMKKSEIQRQFDAIIEFAEVEQFLDTPVKRYSSGMYVRLAFAVAAHLNPEILIVDEVLAVGDANFQKKCLGKMGDVAKQGRTILFVSHNMTAVQMLCERCILLQDGNVGFDGSAFDATMMYGKLLLPSETSKDASQVDLTQRVNPLLPKEILIRQITFQDEQGAITNAIALGSQMTIDIDVNGLVEYGNTLVGLRIRTDSGDLLAGFNTQMRPPRNNLNRSYEETYSLVIPRVPFMPGTYWVDLGADEVNIRQLDYIDRAACFHVLEADVYSNGHPMSSVDGAIYLEAEWKLNKKHGGEGPDAPYLGHC